MRKWTIVVALLLYIAVLTLRAQTGAIQYFAPPAGTTVANCGTPTSGFPLCGVATGWYIWNGTAWVQLGVAAAGVTSITINGGAAQTGPVALTIPTKAASTTTTTIQ